MARYVKANNSMMKLSIYSKKNIYQRLLIRYCKFNKERVSNDIASSLRGKKAEFVLEGST